MPLPFAYTHIVLKHLCLNVIGRSNVLLNTMMWLWPLWVFIVIGFNVEKYKQQLSCILWHNICNILHYSTISLKKNTCSNEIMVFHEYNLDLQLRMSSKSLVPLFHCEGQVLFLVRPRTIHQSSISTIMDILFSSCIMHAILIYVVVSPLGLWFSMIILWNLDHSCGLLYCTKLNHPINE